MRIMATLRTATKMWGNVPERRHAQSPPKVTSRIFGGRKGGRDAGWATATTMGHYGVRYAA